MHGSFAAETPLRTTTFRHAATSWRGDIRGSVFDGCDLSLDDRRRQAARAGRNLAHGWKPVHVWAGTGRTLHGAAGRSGLRAGRVGIVSPAQLGLDDRNCILWACD